MGTGGIAFRLHLVRSKALYIQLQHITQYREEKPLFGRQTGQLSFDCTSLQISQNGKPGIRIYNHTHLEAVPVLSEGPSLSILVSLFVH